MTRDMAKAMSQHFMDARLIENAADPSSNLFKDRGVYILTPKGLHVLERFISKNGINSDHLQQVFATQPICIKLLHLERRSVDDEIIVTPSVITALFRRFVGRQPNYPPQSSAPNDAFQLYHERSKGVALMDVAEKKGPTHKCCFAAVTALEWLCDFTSVVGREEAAEMAAQFVRFGLIVLVSDKRKNNDSAIIFTVRGSAPGGNSPVSVCIFSLLLMSHDLSFCSHSIATRRVPLYCKSHLQDYGRRPASCALGRIKSHPHFPERINFEHACASIYRG
jgi:GTPase-activating protein SST2